MVMSLWPLFLAHPADFNFGVISIRTQCKFATNVTCSIYLARRLLKVGTKGCMFCFCFLFLTIPVRPIIYQTGFRQFSGLVETMQMVNLKLLFQSFKGRCHGNQLLFFIVTPVASCAAGRANVGIRHAFSFALFHMRKPLNMHAV